MARALTTPHQAADLSSADTLLLLRLDEASSTDTAVDAAGAYTFTRNGAPAVVGSLFAGGSSGARDFDGAADYFDGSADTAARDALKTNHTVEAWFRPASVSGTQVLFALTGTGSSGTQNTLGSLRLQGTELRYRWEHGASTQVNVDTSGLGLEADETYHAAVVVSDATDGTASKCNVSIYLGKVADRSWALVHSEENLTRATGGGSADWFVGATYGGAGLYEGAIDDVRISTFDGLPEFCRHTFATGVSSYDEAGLYASGDARVTWRALVEDSDGEWRDLSSLTPYGLNFCTGYQLQNDVDRDMADLTLNLWRDVEGWSIARRMASSYLNRNAAGTTDQPLVDVGRKVKIEACVVPSHHEPLDCLYRTRFRGIVTHVDDSADVVIVRARDDGEGLQGVHIGPSVGPYSVGSSDNVATVAQEIIDDSDPASASPGNQRPYLGERGKPTLYSPTASTWTLVEFDQPQVRVLAAITALYDQIGWSCRQRWDDHRQEHRLTAYEPNRSPSFPADLDHTLAPSEYSAPQQSAWSLDEIANVVTVRYRDSTSTGDDGEWEIGEGAAYDNDSIDDYGRREAWINDAWNINTSSEAEDLADIVVTDAGRPRQTIAVAVPFRHSLELQDYVRLEADGRHHDTDLDLAISSLSEQGGAQGISITLGLREKAPSRVVGWWSRLMMPRTQANLVTTTPPTLTNVSAEAMEGALAIRWDWPAGERTRGIDRIEVHVDTTSPVSPSSSTLATTVRGRRAVVEKAPGTYYAVAIAKDRWGNVSAASAEQTITVARRMATASMFRAYGGTTSIGTSWTTLVMGTEEFDTEADYKHTSGEFIARVTGVHHFSACVEVVVAAGDLAIKLQKDTGSGYADVGPAAYGVVPGSPTFARIGASLSIPLKLNAGDKVRLQGIVASSPRNMDAASSWGCHLPGETA